MATLALASGAVCALLGLVAFGPDAARRHRERARSRARRPRPAHDYDPGRERRAERRARELLRTVVGAEDHAMYEELGFVIVDGCDHEGRVEYGYLLYPHRPLVAFDARTTALLAEYCVDFPDLDGGLHGTRLPDADDVLAKWMALRSDEHGLIGRANMHQPGRQVDPDRALADVRRARAWRASRARAPVTASPHRPIAARPVRGASA